MDKGLKLHYVGIEIQNISKRESIFAQHSVSKSFPLLLETSTNKFRTIHFLWNGGQGNPGFSTSGSTKLYW